MTFMIKKLFVLTLVCFSLVSCSSLTITQSFKILNGYFFGYEADSVSKEFFDTFDASFARVKFGGGQSVYLVLAYANPGSYEWRSSDNISIFTSNGQIIKTVGLEKDVEYDSFDINIQKDDIWTKFTFKNPSLYGLEALNTFKEEGKFTYSRFGNEIELSQISQNIYINEIRFKASNTYYIDDKGVVLLTTQKIHPMYPKITSEFFYK